MLRRQEMICHVSPTSASARLARLEETAGFRPFNRTTRAVSPTDGEVFLTYAQQTLETLDTKLIPIAC